MPSDYAKCSGEDCPMRHLCERFTRISMGSTQWWSEFEVEETDIGFFCSGFERNSRLILTP